MTPDAWHAHAAATLAREQRKPTIEEVEDSNDALVLEEEAATYAGLDWREFTELV